MERPKVGLFGGTFNPVHFGHLRLAEEMAERLALDELIFMPAADPPHKSPKGLAPFSERVKMLSMAIKGRPSFSVSDLEGRLSAPSYTVNTMRALREAVLGPDPLLIFLVGFDSFKQVAFWREREELFRLASFAVFLRPGARGGRAAMGEVLNSVIPGWSFSEESQSYRHPGLYPVKYFRQDSLLTISSTALRRRLREGSSVRYLVPDSVRAYIARRGLYLGR